MTTKPMYLAAGTLAATLIVAQGQTPTPSPSLSAAGKPAPELSPLEQSIQDIKKPFSWLTWGADLRVRNEYYLNAVTHSDSLPLNEQDYFRFRGRIWSTITPIDDLSLNVRLTTEQREYMNPSDSGAYNQSRTTGRSGLMWNYGIVDQLNLQWRNVLDLPATLTVGRQEILFGEGWLTGDGTPLDGSWTAFMDAARLTYELKEQKTTIDVVGVTQFARDDAWLPTINNQNRGLTDQNEKAAILNIANKCIKQANLDGYFMYKHDTRLNQNVPPGTRGDNADIYTLGGRLSGLITDHWKYSAEGAYQFGEKQDPSITRDDPSAHTSGFRDVDAYGFNSKLIYLFNDTYKNQVGMSYEFLSGDNPGTENDEMFDIMWGRYPRWSDLIMIQGNVAETRVGQMGNLHRFGPTWTITPLKDLSLSASYYALFADQAVPTRANRNVYTGDDTFRGSFVQTVLRYKFNQHVSTLLMGEVLFPGKFYSNREMESFLRAEVMFTF